MDVTKVSDTPTLSGYVVPRQTLRGDTNTFSIERARFTMQTQPGSLLSLRLQADFAAVDSSTGRTEPSFALTDGYVQLSPPESSVTYRRFQPALLIGQFKTPFSLEFLTPFPVLYTANRSEASDSLATRRDIGAMGQAQGWDRLVLAAAVVNGNGSNNPSNPFGDEMVIGRLTLFPIKHNLAVAGSWLGHGGDHRWASDVRWLSDTALASGSFVVEGEWIRRTGAVVPAVIATDGSGGYALAVWRAQPWLETVAKWERLRESHSLATITTERWLRWTTLGVVVRTPERAERLRIQVNWIAKREWPEPSKNELVLQFIAQF